MNGRREVVINLDDAGQCRILMALVGVLDVVAIPIGRIPKIGHFYPENGVRVQLLDKIPFLLGWLGFGFI
jgi:hypothetical protein